MHLFNQPEAQYVSSAQSAWWVYTYVCLGRHVHDIPHSGAVISPPSSMIQTHNNKVERIYLEKNKSGRQKAQFWFKSSLYQNQGYVAAEGALEKINPKLTA